MSDTQRQRRYRTGPLVHSDLFIASAFIAACIYVLVLQFLQVARPDTTLIAGAPQVIQLSNDPLEINSQVDPSSLRGFYPPEDHGAWLGDTPGRILLRATQSPFPAGVELLVKAAASGQSETRTLTIRANDEKQDFVIQSGSISLIQVTFEQTQEILLHIECRPSARPPGDSRALCVLISQIAFLK